MSWKVFLKTRSRLRSSPSRSHSWAKSFEGEIAPVTREVLREADPTSPNAPGCMWDKRTAHTKCPFTLKVVMG